MEGYEIMIWDILWKKSSDYIRLNEKLNYNYNLNIIIINIYIQIYIYILKSTENTIKYKKIL